MPKPSGLAAPPLRSGRLPFQWFRRERTNSAYNLAPSTQSEPFGPSKHKTDRLWQCRRRLLRLREREAKISSVNPSYPHRCIIGCNQHFVVQLGQIQSKSGAITTPKASASALWVFGRFPHRGSAIRSMPRPDDGQGFRSTLFETSLQTSKIRTPSIGSGRRITSGSASVRRASS